MYQIEIKQARFFIPLGVFKEEKILFNEIIVDCKVVYSSLPKSIDYINYVSIYNLISSSFNDTQETLEQHIELIKNELLKLYPFAHFYIKICKQNPPIHAEIKEVCVSWTNIK